MNEDGFIIIIPNFPHMCMVLNVDCDILILCCVEVGEFYWLKVDVTFRMSIWISWFQPWQSKYHSRKFQILMIPGQTINFFNDTWMPTGMTFLLFPINFCSQSDKNCLYRSRSCVKAAWRIRAPLWKFGNTWRIDALISVSVVFQILLNWDATFSNRPIFQYF